MHRERERGMAWDDPALGIVWPVPVAVDLLAAKDRENPKAQRIAGIFYLRVRASRLDEIQASEGAAGEWPCDY